jgi:hypothetical protein
MTPVRPQGPDEPEFDRSSPWFDRREFGRLLRLLGPLIQVPLLWMFLRKPDLVRTRPELIYGGMSLGFALVLIGIVLSSRKRPKT